MMMSFGPKRPERISFASGFSICCWMARAELSGAYTMAEISTHFCVHHMTVSRALQSYEYRKARDMTA